MFSKAGLALGTRRPVSEELKHHRRLAAVEEAKALGIRLNAAVAGAIRLSLSIAYGHHRVPLFMELMVGWDDGAVIMNIRETDDDELEQVRFTIPAASTRAIQSTLRRKSTAHRPDLAAPKVKRPVTADFQKRR